VDHDFVLNDALRLHLLTSGTNVETLYLHGVGGSAWTFDATLRSMPDPGSWACVDLLGYGSSSWLPDGDYTTARQVDAIGKVLDRLAADRVDLVGFSWGGLIALELARRDPRVSKVVMIDIAPATDASVDDVPAVPARYASLSEAVAAVLRQAPRASNAVALREALLSTRPVSSGLEKEIDPALLRRWQFRAEDHWASLGEVVNEILLVRAQSSPVLSATTAADMVAVARRASLVEIPDAGHLIPLEQPELLAAVLHDFLDSR
jgi:pimeloyl-ACP methyl ester carboxylesterase